MFSQLQNNVQSAGGFTTPTMDRQSVDLLGAQQGNALPTFDPGILNTTAIQPNMNVTNMVKALKGGV